MKKKAFNWSRGFGVDKRKDSPRRVRKSAVFLKDLVFFFFFYRTEEPSREERVRIER